jgi:hypothetical protein
VRGLPLLGLQGGFSMAPPSDDTLHRKMQETNLETYGVFVYN